MGTIYLLVTLQAWEIMSLTSEYCPITNVASCDALNVHECMESFEISINWHDELYFKCGVNDDGKCQRTEEECKLQYLACERPMVPNCKEMPIGTTCRNYVQEVPGQAAIGCSDDFQTGRCTANEAVRCEPFECPALRAAGNTCKGLSEQDCPRFYIEGEFDILTGVEYLYCKWIPHHEGEPGTGCVDSNTVPCFFTN